MRRALIAALLLTGCRLAPGPDDGPNPAPEPVDPLDPDYVQVGSFNIDWLTADLPGEFTPRTEADLERIGALLVAMDIDVLTLQEIDGAEALEALGLPEVWAWELGSTGWSQNVAFLYRTDRVLVENVREVRLPTNSFPSKDPLIADVTVDGSLEFTFVGLHLNPYAELSEARYRARQVEDVASWLDGELDEGPARPVVVAGDLNDTRSGINVDVDALQPLEDRLAFATVDTETPTNIPFASQIDHVALAEPLEALRHGAGTEQGVTVVLHDRMDGWSDYAGGWDGEANVSTHRPIYVDLRLE